MNHHPTGQDSPPPRVAVVGSINHDSVIRVSKLPRPGETVSGLDHVAALGGKGANQAVAAALAGAEVEFVGSVGDDAIGAQALAELRRYGVGTTQVATLADVTTGLAHIHVADDGENAIVLSAGANGAHTTMSQPGLGVLSWAEVVLLQLEVPIALVTEAARRAHELGRWVVLTPAPARELPVDLLENVDVLVPNEVEALQITGESDLEVACRALAARGVNVLNTRGAAGCHWYGRDGERITVPAQQVVALDTTGAGDCFAGNFAAQWIRTGNVRAAMTWATTAASLSVQRLGAAQSMPTREQVAAATASALSTNRKEQHAQHR